MCNKPFDSIICNFAFFLTAYAGLAATSGVALRLGGILMSKQEPENTEYPFYAAEAGFFIGVKNAAFFQWLTAGFVTMFARMNAENTDKQLGSYIGTVCLQNFLLITMFGALHYFTLPVTVQSEVNCMDFKAQFNNLGGEPSKKSPLCDADHAWDSLFTAFFVGTSIFFAGSLLLQTIYFCLRLGCETQATPETEPVTEAPVIVTELALTITAVEMMSMPTPSLAIQPRLS